MDQNTVTENVAAVIKELNSSYGNTLSSVSPYKLVTGVEFVMSWYSDKGRDMCAKFNVTAHQQSPYGDNADTHRQFKLTRAEVHELGMTGCQFHKFFTAMACKLDEELPAEEERYETRRREKCMEDIKTMRTLRQPIPRIKSISFD